MDEKKTYKFFVDGKPFETESKYLSGAQIKAIAGVDPSYGLFLEEHGADKPDKQISDTQSVDFAAPGVEKFYSVPPATFGSRKWGL